MLPAGLTLDPNTGNIGGVPTVSGTFTFTVQARDANGVVYSLSFTLTVAPLPSFTTPATLPSGEQSVAYTLALASQGGTPPYSNFQVTA